MVSKSCRNCISFTQQSTQKLFLCSPVSKITLTISLFIFILKKGPKYMEKKNSPQAKPRDTWYISFTGPKPGFPLVPNLVFVGATHVAFYAQKSPGEAHLFAGLRLVWILNFSSPRTIAMPKLKHSSLPNNLLITSKTIVAFISFPRVLTLCEIPTASLSIWTWIEELSTTIKVTSRYIKSFKNS